MRPITTTYRVREEPSSPPVSVPDSQGAGPSRMSQGVPQHSSIASGTEVPQLLPAAHVSSVRVGLQPAPRHASSQRGRGGSQPLPASVRGAPPGTDNTKTGTNIINCCAIKFSSFAVGCLLQITDLKSQLDSPSCVYVFRYPHVTRPEVSKLTQENRRIPKSTNTAKATDRHTKI